MEPLQRQRVVSTPICCKSRGWPKQCRLRPFYIQAQPAGMCCHSPVDTYPPPLVLPLSAISIASSDVIKLEFDNFKSGHYANPNTTINLQWPSRKVFFFTQLLLYLHSLTTKSTQYRSTNLNLCLIKCANRNQFLQLQSKQQLIACCFTT